MKLKKIYNEALGKLEYLELVHDVVADELGLEVIYKMYEKLNKIVGIKMLQLHGGVVYIIGEEYIEIQGILNHESVCIGYIILHWKQGRLEDTFEIKDGVGLIK